MLATQEVCQQKTPKLQFGYISLIQKGVMSMILPCFNMFKGRILKTNSSLFAAKESEHFKKYVSTLSVYLQLPPIPPSSVHPLCLRLRA